MNHTERFAKFLQSDILLYCAVLLLVLKISTSVIYINFPKNIFFADITKSALENFVNQTRQSAGLQPLAESSKLNTAAKMKAENMIADNYFNHTSPSGIAPWHWFSEAGYKYKYAGENLAIGFFESEEVFKAWLDSPSHRANILNPNYKEIGTSVLSGFGSNNAVVVVQEFGSQVAQPVATVAKIKENEQNEQPVKLQTTGEVLSQQIETKTEIKNPYDYNWILQDIIYGALLVVTGALLSVILFNFNKLNLKKQLVIRAFIIVILLSVAAVINKDFVVLLIPHKTII